MRHPVHSRLRRVCSVLFLTALFLPSSAATARAASASDAFHFYPPLVATKSGDSNKFDPTVLGYITVDLCAISRTSCTLVKEFTSQSSGSDAIRIETTSKDGSYYIVNWDSRTVNLGNAAFRISVFVAGLQLGSIDVAPPQYRTFPRTWPIKFLIEKNPTIHVRVLRSIGQSAGQIAWDLRKEFNLSEDDIAALLAADQDPFTQTEIDVALKGVFQEGVVIPDTTKIADPATRAALTSIDFVKGTMVFSAVTDLLKNLRTGDVVVSEPSAIAPYGYLRKVTSIQKKPGQVVLGTVQARINDAVQHGTFAAAGDLKPTDLVAVQAVPGVTVRTADPLSPTMATDIGDGFNFSTDIDVTLDSQISGDGFNGSGHMRIQGKVRFNAGYDMGFGVETCLDIPPVCVDRVEAHMGLDQYSEIHVNGNLDGTLDKETVLATEYFKPIVFFIGPVPVVLVPVVHAIAGVHGETHVAFGFAGEAQTHMNLGAKWTDPGDGGQGWQNVSTAEPLVGAKIDADLSGNLLVRGYGMADAELLLYGVAGPALDGRVGIRAEAQYPGNPIWRLWADGDAAVNFKVDIGGVLKLQEYKILALPTFQFQLAAASNQAPNCYRRMDVIRANPTQPITLGPSGGGFQGFFDCTDPEGEDISYNSATSSNTQDGPNKDGVLPFVNGLLRPTFLSTGTRTINITARDPEGNTKSFTLTVNVVNTPPVLTIGTATNTVPATVQYFITASAYDWESQQFLTCSQIAWSVSSPDAVTVRNSGGCNAVVIFAQPGTRTVTVTATDSFGGTSVQPVTVTVTNAPSNPPPAINSMSVVASQGPGCFLDGFLVWHCEVPDGSLLYNGQTATADSYYSPLTLKLSASDPNHDTLTIHWFCQAGSNQFDVTDNGDGTFSCSPGITSTPIAIWASVSDGVTTVYTEVRHYQMLKTTQ